MTDPSDQIDYISTTPHPPTDPRRLESSHTVSSHTESWQTERRFLPQPVGAESIGWGILGTGERAKRIVLEAIRKQPPIAPNLAATWAVGVYSHSEQRATQFAHTHYLPHSFTNLADLLQRQEIQCVYIASHPRHHFPLTMAALTAGKHVLCESPLALSIEEAQTMQLAAEHRGLLLGVGHQFRADPAIRQFKHLLADQMIGDLLGGRITNTTPLYYHQQSWRLQQTAGGVLRNRTPHAIDLIHYLLQDEVAMIYATSSQQLLSEGAGYERADYIIDEDVQSFVTLRASKLTIQLHDSFYIPHLPTILEFYGTRGTLQVQHWADLTRPSRLLLIQNHQIEPLPVPPGDADRQLIATFTQAVRHHEQSQRAGKGNLLASAEAGVKSLRIALAAQQSLRTGRAIRPVE